MKPISYLKIAVCTGICACVLVIMFVIKHISLTTNGPDITLSAWVLSVLLQPLALID